MLDQKQTEIIKKTAAEFFDKMTIDVLEIKAGLSTVEITPQDGQTEGERDVVDLDVNLTEPQILIGQQGQTLFEVQRILRTILNKKLQKTFYFNLDINDYKKKKVEYLQDLAKETADQAVLLKTEKALPAMSAYERRIIHAELAQRADVITESRGDGPDRHIVVMSR